MENTLVKQNLGARH